DADCTFATCGDAVLNVLAGESCDGGGATASCDADCTAARCGDGVFNVLAGEACDGGGATASCDTDCTAASCGDGLANGAAGESCDDGGESATCDLDCSAAACGDGVVNATAGESCDDAGASASCDADCTSPTCGDGVVNVPAGETCDDAGESTTCDVDCTAPSCGDGIVNASAGELCDGAGETASCDDDCTTPSCGDGNANAAAGEACDGAGATATCDADCTLALCGDGTLNPAAGEACDDGDTANGDACSDVCATCPMLDFDGVDDWVTLPDGLPTPSALTMELWAELVADGGVHTLFATRCGAISYGPGTLYPNFFATCEGNAPRYHTAANVVLTDGWHHLAVVYPDTASVQIWIDGALAFDGATTEDLAQGDFIAGSFAALDDLTLASQSLFTDVTIAEARVSSTARYVAPFVPPITFAADASTLARYAFDEGSGTVIGDASALGLDGTVMGDPVWGSYCYQP
ncbi:MAG TPA: LamG-like jellyroll fold domain-containing protein, partial [Nannocystaceae bacterium]|nr:LamG-like jellyroll fold domain-containing protein [Nannocystaceae bacterium]